MNDNHVLGYNRPKRRAKDILIPNPATQTSDEENDSPLFLIVIIVLIIGAIGGGSIFADNNQTTTCSLDVQNISLVLPRRDLVSFITAGRGVCHAPQCECEYDLSGSPPAKEYCPVFSLYPTFPIIPSEMFDKEQCTLQRCQERVLHKWMTETTAGVSFTNFWRGYSTKEPSPLYINNDMSISSTPKTFHSCYVIDDITTKLCTYINTTSGPQEVKPTFRHKTLYKSSPVCNNDGKCERVASSYVADLVPKEMYPDNGIYMLNWKSDYRGTLREDNVTDGDFRAVLPLEAMAYEIGNFSGYFPHWYQSEVNAACCNIKRYADCLWQTCPREVLEPLLKC